MTIDVREPSSHLIAEMPDRERPRERLLDKGADALRDAELLAILLRTGRKGRSAVRLAEDVLLAFGHDLDALSQASVADLRKVNGIGTAKAIEIRAAFALAHRLAVRQVRSKDGVEGPADVAALLRERFRGLKQEEFHVLLLDTKHRLLRDIPVTIGLVDRSQVHAREVFREAIRESCSRVILAHNHPSGDPTPSPQDIACTKNLVAAGNVIGIEVLDHVVVGRATSDRPFEYISFREEGLL